MLIGREGYHEAASLQIAVFIKCQCEAAAHQPVSVILVASCSSCLTLLCVICCAGIISSPLLNYCKTSRPCSNCRARKTTGLEV